MNEFNDTSAMFVYVTWPPEASSSAILHVTSLPVKRSLTPPTCLFTSPDCEFIVSPIATLTTSVTYMLIQTPSEVQTEDGSKDFKHGAETCPIH